ncbi:ubiquitin-related domain-containing protein [Aspergillus desertorum]
MPDSPAREEPRRSRSRSRSPPRRPKVHGGFRWKDKRTNNDDQNESDARLDRGYRNRSPRRPLDREGDRERDRDRYRDRGDYRDRTRYRDQYSDRDSKRNRDSNRAPKEKREKKPKPAAPTGAGEAMIIVHVNDRLGTKAAIPCLPSDTVGNFKALVAAHIGREPHEILLKRQGERPFKDFITLADYSIGNGVQLDLEVGTGD